MNEQIIEDFDSETINITNCLYSSIKQKFILKNEYNNLNFLKNYIEEFYFDNKYYLNNEIDNSEHKIKIIDEPVIIINTLHSCWSHAFIDFVFPYYWTYENIKNKFNIDEIIIFVRKGKFEEFPNNKNFVTENNLYIKNYQNILNIIPHKKIIFEHLLEDNILYKFNNSFHYILNDKHQRSIWNCKEYYYNRIHTSISNVKYNDIIIKKYLNNFSKLLLDRYNLSNYNNNNNNSKKNIIILNKKIDKYNTSNSRLVTIPYLDYIIKIINSNSNLNFNGIKYLEDLEFVEQVKIFIDNDIILSAHGGSLLHMINVSNKTIIEFINDINTSSMFKRACQITNNNHIQYHVNQEKISLINSIQLNIFKLSQL